ncbi:SHOCT domain-containing protein [uncultured Sphingomonas sp.]|uniref:SHOCT domain-containing protein n=1 Tax=uncultured Sphingomonas sp. TaxID=158754 RepID=UPI0025F552DB|nr:SHOCT domain-containing protein [uncultured Sphingomonas sp.]
MAESGLKAKLIDPASAMFTYSSGFQWGWVGKMMGGRTWGWIACGAVNAKNRLGGYVGADRFYVLSDASGAVTWGYLKASMSTCDNGTVVPVQPELQATAGDAARQGGSIGVADELAKLAGLREKGLLTQAEFDAQKAKLLAR